MEETKCRQFCWTPCICIFRNYIDIVMVVHYKDLGVPDPKGWNRAHAKCSVYEYNTSAGSFYYQVRK